MLKIYQAKNCVKTPWKTPLDLLNKYNLTLMIDFYKTI